MKALKIVAAAVAAVALLSAQVPAQAHDRGRIRGGVVLNFGYGWPGYWGPGYLYPPPVYYYPRAYVPPVVVAPESPPVYVERDAPDELGAAPAPPVWWYWCPSAKGYYPYVKECADGWQRVPPQPMPPAN